MEILELCKKRVIDIVESNYGCNLRREGRSVRKRKLSAFHVNLDNPICRISFFFAHYLSRITSNSISAEIAYTSLSHRLRYTYIRIFVLLYFFADKHTLFTFTNLSQPRAIRYIFIIILITCKCVSENS